MSYLAGRHDLKKTGKQMFLCIFLLILVACRSESEEPSRIAYNDTSQLLLLDKVHRNLLLDIKDWLIQDGVALYYQHRDMNPLTEYVKSKGFDWRLTPGIDRRYSFQGKQYYTCARLVIRSRHFEVQSWCLEKIAYKNAVYEYWVIHEISRGRPYSFRECQFILTRAETEQSPREVIFQSDQFFEQYPISDEFIFSFPEKQVNNLYIGSYPHCFQETDMPAVTAWLARMHE